MKLSSNTFRGTLFHLVAYLRRKDPAQKYAGDELPLRSELFSSDQMTQHGKALAKAHGLSLERAPDQLLSRLAENEIVLIGACDLLTEAVKANRRIAPAGEWLELAQFQDSHRLVGGYETAEVTAEGA